MDVIPMLLIIRRIPDPMVCIAALPNLQSLPPGLADRMRITTFDQLHDSFQGDLLRRNNRVNVVRHDHEFVQVEIPVPSISVDCIEKELGKFVDMEKAAAIPSLRSDEIRSEIISSMRDQQ